MNTHQQVVKRGSGSNVGNIVRLGGTVENNGVRHCKGLGLMKACNECTSLKSQGVLLHHKTKFSPLALQGLQQET